MTKEEQRIAIAEACGWKVVDETTRLHPEPWPDATVGKPPTLEKLSNRFRLVHHDGLIASFSWSNFGKAELLRPTLKDVAQKLPNYPEDLNACFEMEKVLDEDQQDSYWCILRHIVDVGLDDMQHCFNTIHATAAQRCEAFCRVMWPERWKGKA